MSKRNAIVRVLCVAAVSGMLAGAVGCSRSLISQPLDESYAALDGATELDFWHGLPGRSAVSNSEGLHGLLLLIDGEDPTGGWDERLALVKEKGWLDPDFDEPGNIAMQRGTLAQAICRAIELRGGVMMRVTGAHPRYAVRELAYERIMKPATENQVISGLEYVGVMAKTQDYTMLRESRRLQRESERAAPAPDQPAPNGGEGEGAAGEQGGGQPA
jgi:hypothetical protein